MTCAAAGGRALDEAGIAWVGAHSPQAKGRVERSWGTAQERAASELRRTGATTLEDANEVLARYVPATPAGSGCPGSCAGLAAVGLALAGRVVVGFHYPRRAAADDTLPWDGRTLAIPGWRAAGRAAGRSPSRSTATAACGSGTAVRTGGSPRRPRRSPSSGRAITLRSRISSPRSSRDIPLPTSGHRPLPRPGDRQGITPGARATMPADDPGSAKVAVGHTRQCRCPSTWP
jgi:hypothetical protein